MSNVFINIRLIIKGFYVLLFSFIIYNIQAALLKANVQIVEMSWEIHNNYAGSTRN